MPAWCPQRTKEGIRFPGSGVMEMVVGYHMDAGNQTRSSGKSARFYVYLGFPLVGWLALLVI